MTTATIRDVARKAGVGVGTVSRVINGSPAVSKATRQKVLDAIETLDFSPNLVARRLSLGKTQTIGVIVPYFTNPSVVERLRGVVSVIAASDYDMVLFDVETVVRREACLRDVPRRRQVDGLLIVSLELTNEEVERLDRSDIPTVLVDARHPDLNQIVVDNVEGGYTATKHLIKLGHRRIAYISDFLNDPFNSPVRDRFIGYKRALDEAGISFRPDYHRQSRHGREEARKMTHTLLDLDEPPTAIFAYCDTQAIGVLEAARERSLSVPADLSVIGFDDIEAAEYLNITTVRQALYESGVQGSKLLLKSMATESPNPQRIFLPTKLMIRHTTASPRGVSVKLP
ncbi:MAG: LacI family DNA-binding transcriptional regulator [Candidatus Promineifilaceae bacterium]